MDHEPLVNQVEEKLHRHPSPSPSLPPPPSYGSSMDTLKTGSDYTLHSLYSQLSANKSLNKEAENREPIGTFSEPSLSPKLPTEHEVRSLLTKAYDVIAEKEKELDQAFNVRRLILEENAALKSECELLKDTLNDPSLLSHNPPHPQLPHHHHLPRKPSDDNPNRNRLSSYNFVSRNDDQSLVELELQAATLQKRLDQVLADKVAADRNGRKENRSLLNEIDLLKQEVEASQKKIRELEESNLTLAHQKRSSVVPILERGAVSRRGSQDHAPANSFGTGVVPGFHKSKLGHSEQGTPANPSTHESENKDLSVRLMENIAELEKSNRKLAASQRAAEEQTKTLQSDLDNLRSYVSDLERVAEQAEQNQFIIDQQAKQITELMARFEPRQGPFLSQLLTPRSSISSIATAFNHGYQNTPTHSIKMVHNDRRFSSAKGHRRTLSDSSAAAGNQPRRTLLSELEGEFYRHFNGSSKRKTIDDWVQSSYAHSNSLLPSELSDLEEDSEEELRSRVTRRAPLTTTASPLGSLDHFPPQSDEKQPIPLVPRRPRAGPVGIVNVVRRCVNSVWKWCRFMALLFVAVGMAFYRGPDADIADYYYD